MDNATAMPMPPGGPIEIVFSFDTTGSMGSCLPQVRANISHVIERLSADIPALKIAVFAHGDYCDSSTYITKHIDFTNDVAELCKFVKGVSSTGGGDFEECYELVLREVREKLSWQPGTQRSLVMIGDATPHEPDYNLNKKKIDWRVETERLANEMGVRIYAVQCLNNGRSDDFYRHLAETTGGKHLKLDDLLSITEMMMAICYRERGVEYVEAFEQQIRGLNTGGMKADLERMFGTLKARTDGSLPPTPVKRKTVFGTPPPTPGTSKLFGSSKRARSPSPDSDYSSSPSAGAGSSGSSRKRRKTGPVTHTRSKAHPMSRRTKPSDDTAVKRSSGRKRISKKCAERVLRERTARKDFILAKLRWSHWREAMAIKAPKDQREYWEVRSSEHPGSKRSYLFNDMDVPAVYEVAVQPPESKAKVAVFTSMTKGLVHRSWEAALLSRPHIKSQIDRVLKKKCKLYIRRARFSAEDLQVIYEKSGIKDTSSTKDSSSVKDTLKELRGLVHRSCDYAWKMHYDTESRKYTHRPLVKSGTVISE